MNCPNCKCPLHIREIAGLELDRCLTRYGLWFDKNELRPFIEFVLQQRADVEDADYESLRQRYPIDGPVESEYDCPCCGVAMAKFNYAVDSNVIVDRCSDCEGLWVEKPEIRGLASFLKGSAAHDRLFDASSHLASDVERVRDAADRLKMVAGFLSARPRFGKWT